MGESAWFEKDTPEVTKSLEDFIMALEDQKNWIEKYGHTLSTKEMQEECKTLKWYESTVAEIKYVLSSRNIIQRDNAVKYQKENEVYQKISHDVFLIINNAMNVLGNEHPEYICLRDLYIKSSEVACRFHKYLPHNQEPEKEKPTVTLITMSN